jgi:integrase
MSLHKKKDSPYYYTRFTIKGVRIQESTKCVLKEDAKRYEERRQTQVREELLFGTKPKHTWKEAKARFLREKKHKRSLSDDKDKFKYLSKKLDELYLSDITKELIETIARNYERKVKPATVNRMLSLISAVLHLAHKEWEWIDKVPHIRKRVEDNARERYITRSEAKRLIECAPDYLKGPIILSLATGQRASNIKDLKWSDLDLERKIWVITRRQFKTDKTVGIPLNVMAMEVLLNRPRTSEYVFTYRGRRIRKLGAKAFRKAVQEAGLVDFKWHDLRHTWASWFLQEGGSLHELQQLGAWSSYSMVLRYGHLSKDSLRKAAEKIKL